MNWAAADSLSSLTFLFPTPWPLVTLINSRIYLAQFGLVLSCACIVFSWACIFFSWACIFSLVPAFFSLVPAFFLLCLHFFSCIPFFCLVTAFFLLCRAIFCFLLLSFSISCVSVRTYGNVTARKVSHCRTKQKLFTSFVFTLLLISSFSLQFSFHIKW